MPLSKEQKKEYQKEYMRKKRSNKTPLDPYEKPVRPAQDVRPLLDPKPLDPVRPLLDPEYNKGYKAGFQAGYDKAKSEMSSVASHSDTVYEPDPVKPVRKAKQSVTKHVAPIVNAMLLGVRKRVTVAHHTQCKCGMCKQAA